MHELLVGNIIKTMPYNGCSQMVSISIKTKKKSFITHPWCLLSVVGLEDYSAHDWRAASSVQRAPVTWREWGLWSESTLIVLNDIQPNLLRYQDTWLIITFQIHIIYKRDCLRLPTNAQYYIIIRPQWQWYYAATYISGPAGTMTDCERV